MNKLIAMLALAATIVWSAIGAGALLNTVMTAVAKDRINERYLERYRIDLAHEMAMSRLDQAYEFEEARLAQQKEKADQDYEADIYRISAGGQIAAMQCNAFYESAAVVADAMPMTLEAYWKLFVSEEEPLERLRKR